MAHFFKKNQSDRCCLCGSEGTLTGEHKIKASAIRKTFGANHLTITTDTTPQRVKFAQGPKSQNFHFKSKICSICNGTTTQKFDQAFDRFHGYILAEYKESSDLESFYKSIEFVENSHHFGDVCRYFAKLLSCHIADANGPRALAICDFALGEARQNLININVNVDAELYSKPRNRELYQTAAHGGLIIEAGQKGQFLSRQIPTGFRSTLTLGPITYTFSVKFGFAVGLCLRLFHSDFWNYAVRSGLHLK